MLVAKNANVVSFIKNAGVATITLLGVYIAIVSLVSGWEFMLDQISQFWYYVLSLAVGFGIQVGLYIYLKNAIKQNSSPRVLAVSGATSIVTMISCCTHYLVNLLPILGAVGIITIISQYQIQLFWVGLIFNLLGIIYMLNRVRKFLRNV
jgi:Cu+-exporting ATPase